MNRSPFRPNRGLSALGRQDWQRRLNGLARLEDGKDMKILAVAGGKIDGKVPVDQVIEKARAFGLVPVLNGDTLVIARLKRA